MILHHVIRCNTRIIAVFNGVGQVTEKNVLKKNFERMAFVVQELSQKHFKDADIIQVLNDTVKLTREVLHNCFVAGKDAQKVNILNAYYHVLNEVIEKAIKKNEGKDNKASEKKNK